MGASDDEQLATGWGAHEPIDDSVLRRFVFNHADVLRAMASGPTARHASDDDVALVDSGGPVPYNNMAMLLRPVTDAHDPVLDRVRDFYADTGRAGRVALLLSVWPLPDLGPRGWQLGGHPMFVVRPPGPVTATTRNGVEVRDVITVDDLQALEQLAVEGYPLDEARGEPPGSLFPDAAARLRGHAAARPGRRRAASGAPRRSTPMASSTCASPPPFRRVAGEACGRRWSGHA